MFLGSYDTDGPKKIYAANQNSLGGHLVTILSIVRTIFMIFFDIKNNFLGIFLLIYGIILGQSNFKFYGLI